MCADLSDVDLQVQDGGGFGSRPGAVEAALSARGTTLAAQLAQLPLSAHMLAMRGTTRASGGLRAVIRAMRAVVLQVGQVCGHTFQQSCASSLRLRSVLRT